MSTQYSLEQVNRDDCAVLGTFSCLTSAYFDFPPTQDFGNFKQKIGNLMQQLGQYVILTLQVFILHTSGKISLLLRILAPSFCSTSLKIRRNKKYCTQDYAMRHVRNQLVTYVPFDYRMVEALLYCCSLCNVNNVFQTLNFRQRYGCRCPLGF